MQPEQKAPSLIDDRALLAIRAALPPRIAAHAPLDESFRRFIQGGLLVMLEGKHWANLPQSYYGNFRNSYSRHDRWILRNLWPCVAEALNLSDADKQRIYHYCGQRLKRRALKSERRRSRLLSL